MNAQDAYITAYRYQADNLGEIYKGIEEASKEGRFTYTTPRVLPTSLVQVLEKDGFRVVSGRFDATEISWWTA